MPADSLYRINATKTRTDVENEICALEKQPKSVFYEIDPGCPFYKSTLVFPLQSFVSVRYAKGEKETMVRTDILRIVKYPSIIPNREPRVEDLNVGMDVLIPKTKRKEVWHMAEIMEIRELNETKLAKYEIIVAPKKGRKTRVRLNNKDVRIPEGRVMNFCENIERRNKGHVQLNKSNKTKTIIEHLRFY